MMNNTKLLKECLSALNQAPNFVYNGDKRSYDLCKAIEDALDKSKLNKLWDKLGDTPVNDDGEIEQDFLDFPKGTDREDIWAWFEQEFNMSVADRIYRNKP